ncbi:hypothetical protein ACWKTS_20960 [Bacillus toyonensis]
MRFVTAKKEEKVFVGIVDEEEEKVLHLREAQRQKGEKVRYVLSDGTVFNA